VAGSRVIVAAAVEEEEEEEEEEEGAIPPAAYYNSPDLAERGICSGRSRTRSYHDNTLFKCNGGALSYS